LQLGLGQFFVGLGVRLAHGARSPITLFAISLIGLPQGPFGRFADHGFAFVLRAGLARPSGAGNVRKNSRTTSLCVLPFSPA
jgi:hypothetical protein